MGDTVPCAAADVSRESDVHRLTTPVRRLPVRRYNPAVAIFRRKKPEPKPCPQCGQLLSPEALVCDMCGLDMRELQPTPAGGAPSERP